MKKKKTFIDYEDGTRVMLDGDDSQEWTAEDFKKARPAREVFEELWGTEKAQAFLANNAAHVAKRGRPRVDKPKKLKSFKLSQDVIEAIVASGRGYNTRVEAILREAIGAGRI